LGALLRGLGIVTDEEVVESLAKQCNLRIARNFAVHTFSKEMLDLVPSQMALEKLNFPLKRHEGILTVAILDPFIMPASTPLRKNRLEDISRSCHQGRHIFSDQVTSPEREMGEKQRTKDSSH
ncbi:MAG TPA: hypothetical protein VHN12_04505, partial [Geobacteraceae bacterium]|nr:hypothetical protein [Geobacteraceae bacterium]